MARDIKLVLIFFFQKEMENRAVHLKALFKKHEIDLYRI